MTYTKKVNECSDYERPDGTRMLRACIQIQNAAGAVVATRSVEVNLTAHPTLEDARAELNRYANTVIEEITSASTIAENLRGVTLEDDA